MKKIIILLLTLILIVTMFFACGSGNNPNVWWDIPSQETMENNVSIDFDTEEIIDVDSKTTAGTVTEPEDVTVSEDRLKPEDTKVPDTITIPSETTTPNMVTTPSEFSAPETDSVITTAPVIDAHVTTAPQPVTPPTNSTPGGFEVRAKKYAFEGNNLLLLDTENKTDTNYTVGIMVKYYDKNGKTLKTETQTFEGYAAGYRKYFLFNPGITFDSYNYKVITEDYSGECYTDYIDIEFQSFGLFKDPRGSFICTARTRITNEYRRRLDVQIQYVIFDRSGEIKFVDNYKYYDTNQRYNYDVLDFAVAEYWEPISADWSDGCSIIYIIKEIEPM